MQTCRGKSRDNWTTGQFKSRVDDRKQNANIIKEKKSHVIYSVKITTFHCNFDIFYVYITSHQHARGKFPIGWYYVHILNF